MGQAGAFARQGICGRLRGVFSVSAEFCVFPPVLFLQSFLFFTIIFVMFFVRFCSSFFVSVLPGTVCWPLYL